MFLAVYGLSHTYEHHSSQAPAKPERALYLHSMGIAACIAEFVASNPTEA